MKTTAKEDNSPQLNGRMGEGRELSPKKHSPEDTHDGNLSSKIRQIDSEASDWDVGIKDSLVVPAEDVKEAVRLLKAHFTPIDKQWMDVEMFSPREIIEFIDSKFGDKLT